MNKIAYTLTIILNELQTFESLMKIKRQKGEVNVATSTRKFHRGLTSGFKFVSSSSGIKKWKKKKSGQGNKSNLVVAKTSKKAKVAKRICFHCNQEGYWKRNCPKYLAKKKKAKQGKMTKRRFTGKGHKAKEPLELIHSDLCGPMNVKARGGFKCFITFTDDYTRLGTRGGYFYEPKNNKVFVSTNATFLEEDHIREYKPRSKIVLNELSNETTEPSTRIVEEPSALTRVVHVGSSTKTHQPQSLREPRRSGRVTNLSIRYMSLTETLTIISNGNIEDPLSFKKAMEDVDKDEWIKAINLEFESMFSVHSYGRVVVWSSIKQECIADSTMEAEYVAACEATKEAIWLRKFLSDLEVVPNMLKPITLYCDNSGTVANSREPRSHKRGKHIEYKYQSIREIVHRRDVIVTQIASTHNVIDSFTKPPRLKCLRVT
ncbi:retrovirus-related pol polyprotein from transposon tnt 1-94 [Cucumis melo var. makuwa]|uniref:Retrovirus-related pol polyprotein from transposon tnt 1-94 n=1 Tax=Cucumis melo var. makuwa TaxID=1194695 RepID=A0A5D3CWX2_CUCMM|nr:retrovirus-related pol polyprotein from transposon tnt 1-94 [Cucumis melo var. makuwa]